MGKIKLNLVSGAVVEKPLINAFKANNSTYVVLDNEVNGSMGLPIILVCKYINDRLTKIVDQNEWNIVKEYLKNIIAGNQIEFVSINNELLADDIYYTQLTLPVPSFDALKNAYKVNQVEENTIQIEPAPVQNVVEPQITPVAPEVVASPVVEPVVTNEVAVEPIPSVSVAPVIDIPVAPVVETPVVEQQVVAPQIEVTPTPVEVVPPVSPIPEINPMPVNEPVVSTPQVNVMEEAPTIVNDNNIFKDQKEAFMQACENMFDALVQKFEKELENRK